MANSEVVDGDAVVDGGEQIGRGMKLDGGEDLWAAPKLSGDDRNCGRRRSPRKAEWFPRCDNGEEIDETGRWEALVLSPPPI